MAEALARFRAPEEGAFKVQLLRPPRTMSRHYYSILASPPIGLAYVAGVLVRAGYPVQILDAQGEALEQWTVSACGRFRHQGLTDEQVIARIDPDARILGVSLMFSQEWVRNRRLLERIRERFPHLIIVAGGEHATALPRETLAQCAPIDYVVRGEGEITFLALVHGLNRGESVETLQGLAFGRDHTFTMNGTSLRIRDIDSMPPPAWHLSRVDAYFRPEWKLADQTGRTMPILATRGCPYQCTFCSNPGMWTTTYKMRDPVAVVDEIEGLVDRFQIDSVDFFDLTAIVKKSWILAFCRELRARRLAVTWNLPTGTRSEALDEETLRAIYDAGCTFLSYAPESGSARTLKAIKKQIKLDNVMASLRTAVTVGHHTRVFVILGFPHETRRDLWQSFLFIMRTALAGVDDVVVFLFTPYPGSELFDELRAAGVIGELDDAYFERLFAQADMTVRKSYCRAIGWPELFTYRVLATALFYVVGYCRRPSRIVRLLRGVLTGRFEAQNVLERRVVDFARLFWRTPAR
jgi:radical SAM superfamily enzyme YgiQ (UPF0313 family)